MKQNEAISKLYHKNTVNEKKWKKNYFSELFLSYATDINLRFSAHYIEDKAVSHAVEKLTTILPEGLILIREP